LTYIGGSISNPLVTGSGPGKEVFMRNILIDRFLSLSLRTHLLLLALLLSLPAVALIIHTGLDQRNDSIDGGIAESKKLASSIATEQENLTTAAQQLVMVLAQLPQVKERKPLAVNPILANVLRLNPQYANIIITDRDGQIWASALPLTRVLSINDRRAFMNTVKSRQFSAGDYGVGKISEKATIGFGYPIFNAQGKVDGVIAINFNFDHFNNLLHQAVLPIGTVFNIIDCNGVVIDRNLNPENFIGKKVRDDVFMSMMNGPEESTVIDNELTGDRQIISYRKLRLHGEEYPYLYVRVGIPLQATLEKARKSQFFSMVFYSSFLFAAIILAIPIGRHCFVNRIGKLQEASQRLADGDLHIRVSDLLGGGELGKLGQSFDEMARRLANREDALRESETRFRNVMECAPIGMAIVALDGRLVMANHILCEILGYEKGEIEGLSLIEITHPDDLDKDAMLVQSLLKGEIPFYSVEKRCLDKNRKDLWINMTVSLLRSGNNSPCHAIAMIEDITVRRQMEEDLRKAASIDRITGVLNRHTSEARITQEVVRTIRYERAMSLIMLDIDRFKNINDTYGHQVGDYVLNVVASILKSNIRNNDLAGRWGGEEFMIMLPETGEREASLVAEKLRAALEKKEIDMVERVTASFGVTEIRKNDTLDSMLKRVDDALYLAKRNGRNRVEIADAGQCDD
jgi:diguanylate cyclase (GGDEF)-like protein/PAS domain S-box-containing protein